MVSLSLFAGPERVPRRFSIFPEEPRKSIITAIEPCSPVFKEAQARPCKQKQSRAIHSVEFETSFLLYIMCFTLNYLLL